MFGTKILEEKESKFNGHVKVLKSLGLGTYIQSDGLTQSGGIVETFWKQTLKKIKDNDVKTVLILGLGGGTLVKLIKNFWPKAAITGVDIDPLMVDLGEKYLGLKSDDLKIEIGDAVNFTDKKYDLVIVDLYNGNRLPDKFTKDTFIKNLTGNKIVIFNRLYGKNKITAAESFGKNLRKFFIKVDFFYPVTNLMYICFG